MYLNVFCRTYELRPGFLAIGWIYMVTGFVTTAVIIYASSLVKKEDMSDHRRNGLTITYICAAMMSVSQAVMTFVFNLVFCRRTIYLMKTWKVYAWICYLIVTTATILALLIRFSGHMLVFVHILWLGVIAGTYYYLNVKITENTFKYTRQRTNTDVKPDESAPS